MSISHLESGQVVYLPLGLALQVTRTTTLMKTDELEVIHMVVPSGKEISTRDAPGPITVQCLEGRVLFTAQGRSQELDAGNILYLAAGEPHAVQGIEAASLLITMLLPNTDSSQRLDVVQEASEESFPASDARAY